MERTSFVEATALPQMVRRHKAWSLILRTAFQANGSRIGMGGDARMKRRQGVFGKREKWTNEVEI